MESGSSMLPVATMGPKNVGSEEMSITSDASTVQVDNNDSRIHGNKVGINTVIEKPVVPKKQQQQQQHRFGSNDVIPNFAKNGTALTQEERAAIAKRKGLCVQCGVKTHTISVFKKAPLTNDHVYKGLCIKCNPTELPAMVVQAWERRNPRISAPVAPTRTRRAHHQRFSQANVVKPKNRLEAYTTTDDRDIIPIRDIWKESLTIAPTIEDAQDLWLSSLDREIWEPERPPTTSTKTTTGIPTASHPTVNGPATEQPLLDTASATKKPVIPEQIIRGIRDDTASSVASTIDEDGDMEVLSLGTLINDSLLDDDDNKSGSTFENISAPDSKSGTAGSGWSMCSDSREPSVMTSESQKWNPVSIADEDPSLWAISYQQLLAVQLDFKSAFGEAYPNATMHDVNLNYIAPLCMEKGKSYALQQNPRGLPVTAFISHCWNEPFDEFVESIRKTFQTWLVKPNLWICAFALQQGDMKYVRDQVGTEDGCLTNCPFVMALKASKKFVVVRNSATDLFSRIWCVCELMFARKLGFVPNKTFITGPDCFADSRVSCIDAQATNTDDKAKILRVLLTQYDYREIDQIVLQFRTLDAPI